MGLTGGSSHEGTSHRTRRSPPTHRFTRKCIADASSSGRNRIASARTRRNISSTVGGGGFSITSLPCIESLQVLI
ncbi:MAG: hypothetical protein BWY99_02862 [Synergistetes bacterium ADurb.BinA166]|nr:MAG: hypothetical protein BWY99_02862 [Synergistetes bacterium ADurb.BinA166]